MFLPASRTQNPTECQKCTSGFPRNQACMRSCSFSTPTGACTQRTGDKHGSRRHVQYLSVHVRVRFTKRHWEGSPLANLHVPLGCPMVCPSKGCQMDSRMQLVPLCHATLARLLGRHRRIWQRRVAALFGIRRLHRRFRRRRQCRRH